MTRIILLSGWLMINLIALEASKMPDLPLERENPLMATNNDLEQPDTTRLKTPNEIIRDGYSDNNPDTTYTHNGTLTFDAFSITDTKGNNISLRDFIQILPIYGNPMNIEEVLKIPDSEYYSVSQIGDIEKHDKAWIRMKVRNNTQVRIRGSISGCRDFDFLKVYDVNNGTALFNTITGSRIPTSEKTIPIPQNIFGFNLDPGETMEWYVLSTIWNEDYNHYSHFAVSFDLFSFLKNYFYQKLFGTFFAGIMIIFSIFSIVMFLSFKERIFIYYFLFMLAITCYFLSMKGVLQLYFNYPTFNFHAHLQGFMIAAMVILSYLFISNYLNLKEKMPRYNKLYRIWAFITAIFAFFHYFIFNYQKIGYDISNLLIVVYFLSTFIPIIYLVTKKSKEGKVLLYSMVLLFLGGLTFTLSLLRIIPMNTLSLSGFQLGAIAFSGTLFYGLFDKINHIQRDKLKFRIEKEKSDELLFNILPAEVAEELKENGFCEARDYKNVSVLFTDFKDFTAISTSLTAKELVEEINACFSAFDKIIEKRRVEKIKTIGDAYMAAGGLQNQTKSEVKDVVLVGLDMQDFLEKRKQEHHHQNRQVFEMRVGIHTGPVVAGIVGVKKFQYDIWGDTVNTASRIESYGKEGKVNISHSTYSFIKDDPAFKFEERSEIEVKGKGKLKMWFVSRNKSTRAGD